MAVAVGEFVDIGVRVGVRVGVRIKLEVIVGENTGVSGTVAVPTVAPVSVVVPFITAEVSDVGSGKRKPTRSRGTG